MSRKTSPDASLAPPSLIDEDEQYFDSPSFNSPSTTFASSSFQSPPSKSSRGKRGAGENLTNTKGLSKEADRAIVEYITRLQNPNAIKLEQLTSITPALAPYSTKKIRNRYEYLLKTRDDNPLRFEQICHNYVVNPSSKASATKKESESLPAPAARAPAVRATPSTTIDKVKESAKMNRYHQGAADDERKFYKVLAVLIAVRYLHYSYVSIVFYCNRF